MAARPRSVLIAGALALAAGGCVQDDLGRRHIALPGQELASTSSDREQGFAFDREAQQKLPLIRDLTVLEFIDDLGALQVERLGEQPFDYRFRVIADPQLNAFAVPGGYVYFHSGTILAAGDVEELAGVMAHELGHVKGRHQARMAKETAIPSLLTQVAGIAATAATGSAAPLLAAQAANVAIQLQYSRQYEDEADRLATVFLTRSGYSPEGLVRFFERIKLEERGQPEGTVPPYLFSHPEVDARIEVVRGLSEQMSPVAKAPDLDARFREVQARLAWLVAHRREAVGPVAPYDRTASDPFLADAEHARKAGRLDDALALLVEAERSEPNDPRVPLRRAEIREAQGRTGDAIAAYRRAVELDPNQPAVLLALGRAHKAAGDRRRALFFFEQASWRAGPTGRARVQIDGEIERMIFPVVARSGLGARDAVAAPALRAGDARAEWWGQLGAHWLPYAGYLKVRWIDPAGRVAAEAEPERNDRVYLSASHRFENGGAAPGEWRVELRLGDETVHTDRFPVQ